MSWYFQCLSRNEVYALSLHSSLVLFALTLVTLASCCTYPLYIVVIFPTTCQFSFVSGFQKWKKNELVGWKSVPIWFHFDVIQCMMFEGLLITYDFWVYHFIFLLPQIYYSTIIFFLYNFILFDLLTYHCVIYH